VETVLKKNRVSGIDPVTRFQHCL